MFVQCSSMLSEATKKWVVAMLLNIIQTLNKHVFLPEQRPTNLNEQINLKTVNSRF